MGKILHQLRWLMSQVSWSFLHHGWCRISSINSQGNSKTVFYVCCHMPSIRGLPWILLKVVFHSQKYWRYLRPNSWLIPYLENLRSCSFNYCMLCLTPLWDGTCKNLWIWIKSTFPWHKYFNGIDLNRLRDMNGTVFSWWWFSCPCNHQYVHLSNLSTFN